MLDLKILVCFTDKLQDEFKERISSSPYYIPILGGAMENRKNIDFSDQFYKNILFDDEGENISNLNIFLNELTTIYWAWKNYDKINSEYIGFCHYRRFFNEAEIEKAITQENIDIITGIRKITYPNLKRHYELCHNKDDFAILANVMNTMFTKENGQRSIYLEFVDMCGGIFMFPCNMFVMRKEDFFRYCKFLFSIIFNVIKNINLQNRDNYQRRSIGFMAERLTSLFFRIMMLNSYKIKQLAIDFYDKVNVDNLDYHRKIVKK